MASPRFGDALLHLVLWQFLYNNPSCYSEEAKPRGQAKETGVTLVVEDPRC